mmetsp:Transcript_56799/g.179628  ORF Transcript_56799/g.179628 Transcript_56799/m.179628 type:complete len:259 (+) Transcript_56799:309-1085(+)
MFAKLSASDCRTIMHPSRLCSSRDTTLQARTATCWSASASIRLMVAMVSMRRMMCIPQLVMAAVVITSRACRRRLAVHDHPSMHTCSTRIHTTRSSSFEYPCARSSCTRLSSSVSTPRPRSTSTSRAALALRCSASSGDADPSASSAVTRTLATLSVPALAIPLMSSLPAALALIAASYLSRLVLWARQSRVGLLGREKSCDRRRERRYPPTNTGPTPTMYTIAGPAYHAPSPGRLAAEALFPSVSSHATRVAHSDPQ